MPLDPKAKLDFPLHWAVFLDDVEELEELLKQKDTLQIDKRDPRGRTPLMLAVTIGKVKCAQILLKNGADAGAHNKEMWSVSNEAVSLGSAELIKDVVHYRDFQHSKNGALAMKKTLQDLKKVPDFFCEMNWDFTSWVPFVSQQCPSDTYKIYKQGSSVRIDTTLVALHGTNWVRGNQSFIFRINNEGLAEFIVLSHDNRTATIHALRHDTPFDDFKPTQESIEVRLATPISTTYIDVDNIGFEKASRGFLSWFNSEIEQVDGFDCKVLAASNVQLVTKKRTEHLNLVHRIMQDQEQSEAGPSRGISTVMRMLQTETTDEKTTVDLFKKGITAVEYLDKEFEFEKGEDIGKPRDVVKRSQEFKAKLWMSEGYELDLQDQIIPIVELMAVNSPHFARLHKFIRLQLPAGFPVKIEIPLFHVLSARIKFQSVNKPGKYVTPAEKNQKDRALNIEREAFEVPPTYIIMSSEDSTMNITWDDEDDPSMAGQASSPAKANPYLTSEEMQIQMAIEESMRELGTGDQFFGNINNADFVRYWEQRYVLPARGPPPYYTPPEDTEYLKALRASQADDEQRRREEMQFEEELRLAIERSNLEQ